MSIVRKAVGPLVKTYGRLHVPTVGMALKGRDQQPHSEFQLAQSFLMKMRLWDRPFALQTAAPYEQIIKTVCNKLMR